MNAEELSSVVTEALDEAGEWIVAPTSTCVVIPDATRPLPFESTLRPLLERLDASGAPTTILVSLGLHRPMTPEELAPIHRAADGLDANIVQHDAGAPDLVEFDPVDHIPVALNRRVVAADRVICVGTVEPHQYAGYSGGIKAVSIGCAGEATISAMHGLTFLRDRRTTLGRIDDNPFQNALWRIGAPLDDVLGLQLVPAPGGGVIDLFFGEIRFAFDHACAVAADTFFESFDEPVDWLHLPVPPVKASNFYQASRAATYAALVDRPAVRAGGAIIIEADCPEKMGTGAGERACAAAMRRGKDSLLRQLEGTESVQTRGGEQRAYVLAKALRRNRIALVGAPPIPELAPMDIEQFDTLQQAQAALELNPSSVHRIGDIFHRIPTMGRS